MSGILNITISGRYGIVIKEQQEQNVSNCHAYFSTSNTSIFLLHEMLYDTYSKHHFSKPLQWPYCKSTNRMPPLVTSHLSEIFLEEWGLDIGKNLLRTEKRKLWGFSDFADHFPKSIKNVTFQYHLSMSHSSEPCSDFILTLS